MMIRSSFIALLGLGAAAACAPMGSTEADPAARSEGRQCFFTSSVNSFRDGSEDQSIYVRVGVRDEYELTPTGACRDIQWARGIQLQPALGEGGSICVGDLADVRLAGGAAMPGRCQVRVARKLSDEERLAGVD